MRIKYVTFYDSEVLKPENRLSFPSTINKVNYICDVLNRLGYSVDIISSSWTNNRYGFYKSKRVDIDDKNRLIISPTFGYIFKPFKVIQKIFSLFWIFFFLIKNTKKEEELIIYHGMNKILPLIYAKKIKKLRYILEVEEIFSELSNFNRLKTKLEMKMISLGDKYIFSSVTLEKKYNQVHKSFCIVNGNYRIEPPVSCSINDGKIHIVYAGIINKSKGALTSIELAKYLPKYYYIHIIGFGNQGDIDYLVKKIQYEKENGYDNISYDGLLKGKEYIKFIQQCHIGLCPQITDKKYNNASFPSKVSSYLANGLRVIAPRTDSFENSVINKILYYYENDFPEEIAKAILNIDFNLPYDSRKFILHLDSMFVLELKKLLNI